MKPCYYAYLKLNFTSVRIFLRMAKILPMARRENEFDAFFFQYDLSLNARVRWQVNFSRNAHLRTAYVPASVCTDSVR